MGFYLLRRFISGVDEPSSDDLEAAARLAQAKAVDVDHSGHISMPELSRYIDETHAKVWSTLAISLNMPTDKCRDIAANVAFQLAKTCNTGRSICELTQLERDLEPSVGQLESFMKFVKEPKGEQEFFHRTVFEAFDQDGNGYLDPEEIDKFLDVFYEAGSIFSGDIRLPPNKEALKEKVLTELDANHDGKLEFEEIRPLLSPS